MSHLPEVSGTGHLHSCACGLPDVGSWTRIGRCTPTTGPAGLGALWTKATRSMSYGRCAGETLGQEGNFWTPPGRPLLPTTTSYAIVPLLTVQFLGATGQDLLAILNLLEHATNPNSRSVSVQDEIAGLSWEWECWGCAKGMDQAFKRPLAPLIPAEVHIFLGELRQGNCQVSELRNKLPVAVGQTQKLLYLLAILWGSPVPYTVNQPGLRLNTSLGHYQP